MEDTTIDHKKLADLKEKLGLHSNETPKSTLFQGDWGYSIDFSTLSATLLFLGVGAILLLRVIKRKRDHKS